MGCVQPQAARRSKQGHRVETAAQVAARANVCISCCVRAQQPQSLVGSQTQCPQCPACATEPHGEHPQHIQAPPAAQQAAAAARDRALRSDRSGGRVAALVGLHLSVSPVSLILLSKQPEASTTDRTVDTGFILLLSFFFSWLFFSCCIY